MITVIHAVCIWEVMDKEPSLLTTSIRYLGLGLCSWALSSRRWWWGLLPLLLIGAFAVVDLRELHDHFVGQAIINEAGCIYFLAWHGLIAAAFALGIAAALMARRRQLSSS